MAMKEVPKGRVEGYVLQIMLPLGLKKFVVNGEAAYLGFIFFQEEIVQWITEGMRMIRSFVRGIVCCRGMDLGT